MRLNLVDLVQNRNEYLVENVGFDIAENICFASENLLDHRSLRSRKQITYRTSFSEDSNDQAAKCEKLLENTQHNSKLMPRVRFTLQKF